ncbi:MAG: transporter substrate-binding protein [Micrococcaceae bacterium]|nr:transporter substrate-binding protein [Micrococcaceae bacterium]
MRISPPVWLAAGVSALALVLTGCGSASSGASASEEIDGKISVVASSDVYGSVVQLIGGEHVAVTSIISSAAQDPHSYEATAQDKLAVSKAQLAIENGGGYDDFFDTLADGVDLPADRMINVAELSGLQTTAEGHEFNEHLWYSLPTMTVLADAVVGKLSALDATDAPAFAENGSRFKASITAIEAQLADIKAANAGTAVAITEPVPLYLLEEAGLDNGTPEEFSKAVEEGTDVPPRVMKQMSDLIGAGGMGFLAYNDQTEGPQTQAVKAVAEQADVPVVNFSETLPENHDYLGWMKDNVAAIAAALSR